MKRRLLLYSCLFVIILSLSTFGGCFCDKEDVEDAIREGVEKNMPGPKPPLPPGCDDYPPPPTPPIPPKPPITPEPGTPSPSPSGGSTRSTGFAAAASSPGWKTRLCEAAADMATSACESNTLNSKKYQKHCTGACSSSCVHDLCSQIAGNAAYRHCMAMLFPDGC
jgi:hypothetical protein